MTDLERFLLRLVEVLEQTGPALIHRPFSVDDLRERLLPYRRYRDVLGLTSSEDYELLVLRLVSEEGGLVRVLPAESAEDARAEVESSNPALDLVEAIGETTIQIGADGLARLMAVRGAAIAEPASESVGESVADQERGDAAMSPPGEPRASGAPAADPMEPPEAPDPPDLAPSSDWMAPAAPPPPEDEFEPLADNISIDSLPARSGPEADPETAPASCPFCSMALPPHRPVSFCPYCGLLVGATRCSRCAEVIEPGWKHCVACGHQVSPGTFA